MIEAFGDLWTLATAEVAPDAVCITTNSHITAGGKVVMGRGCAKEAKDRFPGLDTDFAALITAHGNRVLPLRRISEHGPWLVAFPVKHHWRDMASLALIHESASQLATLSRQNGWRYVLLPRPGVGNGRRRWSDVKPIIAPLLDDRFVVITNQPLKGPITRF